MTVYSTRSHYGSEPAFELFTKKTGIKVSFFMGNGNEVLERLRAEGKNSPADIMVTVDAGNLWNAAREGLLAPVESETQTKNRPLTRGPRQTPSLGSSAKARFFAPPEKEARFRRSSASCHSRKRLLPPTSSSFSFVKTRLRWYGIRPEKASL